MPLDTTAAEPYEEYILPTFMLRMGKDAVEKTAVQPGEGVLDVACGTGLGARLIAPRMAPGGALDTGSASELIALLEICRN